MYVFFLLQNGFLRKSHSLAAFSASGISIPEITDTNVVLLFYHFVNLSWQSPPNICKSSQPYGFFMIRVESDLPRVQTERP